MAYITRYEPISLLNEVNKVINKALQPNDNVDTSNIETSQWIPAVDICENKNEFKIIADVPGLDKKDINISMENNVLTLKGLRTEEKTEKEGNYYRTERVRGSFYRRFTLPDTADSSKVQAKILKGVLEVCIPKKEAAQPRFIDIKDGE